MIVGESFQVQYVLEGADKNAVIMPASFPGFEIVVGPQVYEGNMSTPIGMIPVKNAVYTLEALRPGKFIITGATALIGAKSTKGKNVTIEVISKLKAAQLADMLQSNDATFNLRPGENVQEIIAKNLFAKVTVDKKSCYAGEPVLATFKLYSRLQSKSDIIKNPGFYGFTVYDMENLQDKVVAEENINGKLFDVHTIRKVQLYPLQPGVFTIDAMQIKSRVEFSRSAVSKKAEQEISEGVLVENDSNIPAEGTEVYESELSTTSISINVKPLPEKNKPAIFNGAVGNFIITAAVANSQLYKNEQSFLNITIQGRGNFTQLDAPEINWPEGIEGFDADIKDLINKVAMPLTGSRTFSYTFVCSQSGSYNFSPVSFSFFDIDSNKFKTISTAPIVFSVGNSEKNSNKPEKEKVSINQQSEKAARVAVIVVASVVLLILLYWISRKKEMPVIPVVNVDSEKSSPHSLLEQVSIVHNEEPSVFYRNLHQAIWTFLSQRFNLSGSEMSKQLLGARMKTAGIDDDTTKELVSLLSQCETAIFTNASLENDKEALLQQTRGILEKIDDCI